MQLQLETIGICHAHCIFCEYSKMTRQRGTMPVPLFCKIIDEATGIPQVDHITLTGLGETLLDKRLIERLKYVRKKMPAVLLDLYTVGTHLTDEKIDALIDAKLSVLYISLNAANKEKRKAITGLDDYDFVAAQCHRAIEKSRGTKTRVLVKAVCAKDLIEHNELEQFTVEWNGPYQQGGNAFVHNEGNWAGATWPMRIAPIGACDRALNQIMVMWDGRVSLCCFDGNGEVVFGDLNRQTIREVYNGPAAVAYRQAHYAAANGDATARGKLKLCSTCTAI